MSSTHTPRHRARAFTLIELIVVVLILGVLAAVAVLGFASHAARARERALAADLYQVSMAAYTHALNDEDGTLDRDDFIAGMASSGTHLTAVSGTWAASWQLGTSTMTPQGPGQFAVAFDDGDGTPPGDGPGTRALLMSATPDGQLWATVLSTDEGTANNFTAFKVTTTDTGTTTPGGVLGDGEQSIPVAPASAPVVTTTSTSSSVTATWAAVADSTGYEVAWRTADGTWSAFTPVAGLSATLSDQAAAADILVQVRAVNAAGTGPSSTQSAGTAPAAPAPVVTATTAQQVTFAWPAVDGATSYTVRSSLDDGATWTPTATTDQRNVTIATPAGTASTIQVSAVGAHGTSDPGTTTGTFHLSAPVPTLTARTGSTLTLTWPAVDGAETYTLTRGGTLVHTGTDLTFTDSSLSLDTAYTYVLTAHVGALSTAADTLIARTLPAPTVTGLTATPWGATAVVTFTGSNDWVYQVAYRTGAGAWTTGTLPKGTFSTTLTGLAASTTYTVTVSAVSYPAATASATVTTDQAWSLTGSRLPAGTTATADSTYAGYNAALSMDGKGSTYWLASGFGGTVTYTFPSLTSIQNVALWVGSNPTSTITYTVSGTNGDGTWATVGTSTQPSVTAAVRMVIVPITSGMYKALKVQVQSSSSWAALTEVALNAS